MAEAETTLVAGDSRIGDLMDALRASVEVAKRRQGSKVTASKRAG
jgi:hypothetical protein